MDRTLYLNENKGLEVIRDGPSIWIKEDGKAGRRIPARLVGRVVVIGNLKLEAGVITLFTGNDIPVTFMNRRGEEVAVTIPYNHHLSRHHEGQRVFLETEENIQRFKMWLYSKRRDVQLGTVSRLSRSAASLFISRGFRERDYQEFIKRHKPQSEEQWKIVNEIISNLFSEMVIGSIMKSDLDPHTGIMHRRHNFGLALDIGYTIGPEADLQGIQFFKSVKENVSLIKGSEGWAVSKEGMKEIIHRFENRKKALHEMVEQAIDDLFALMRELRI